MADRLEGAYQPPHFVHGGRHTHQIFVERTPRAGGDGGPGGGISGDGGEDLLELSLEHAPPVMSSKTTSLEYVQV